MPSWNHYTKQLMCYISCRYISSHSSKYYKSTTAGSTVKSFYNFLRKNLSQLATVYFYSKSLSFNPIEDIVFD